MATYNSTNSFNLIPATHSISGSTDQTLTNPMSMWNTISVGPAASVILPAFNTSISPLAGGLIRITNNGGQAVDIKSQDGGTLTSQLSIGATLLLYVSSNLTANGAFQGFRTDATAITSGSISGNTQIATSANSSVTANSPGGGVNFEVFNLSNTVGSDAYFDAKVDGSSGGDAYYQAIINGATTWSWGADNSDSDAWVLSANLALGTTNVLRASTGGQITKPKQSAFLAYNSVARTNVTGDGTNYTIPFNGTVIDRNSDFNTTTGTFTAPIGGGYPLNVTALVGGFTASVTSCVLAIVTSNRTYQVADTTGANRDLNNNTIINGNVLADMDAADIANVTVGAGGITKVMSISASTYNTTFSGYLAV